MNATEPAYKETSAIQSSDDVASPEPAADHWDERWEAAPELLSWYEAHPTQSLDLLSLAGAGPQSAVIDVGAGASHFVDYLLSRGYEDVTVLDISHRALKRLCHRLGECSTLVDPVVGDVRSVELERKWDVWHDRAVFHFMVDDESREAYLNQLRKHLKPGGVVILATFADDGPTRCSGLPTARYSPEELAETMGEAFEPIELRRHAHRTPDGREQRFVYGLFRYI